MRIIFLGSRYMGILYEGSSRERKLFGASKAELCVQAVEVVKANKRLRVK